MSILNAVCVPSNLSCVLATVYRDFPALFPYKVKRQKRGDDGYENEKRKRKREVKLSRTIERSFIAKIRKIQLALVRVIRSLISD